MAEVEFNPVSVYNKLANLRVKQYSNGKICNEEAQPISFLRIEAADITKNINRYRACDNNSRFYCREWVQFIYKKKYTWATKNQNFSITGNNNNQINNIVNKPKQNATDKCQQLFEYINNYKDKFRETNSDIDYPNIFESILQKVFDWIKAPSNLYSSPNVFIPVEFNYPNQVLCDNENNDLPNLLEKVSIEKNHYQISKENFPLLKLIVLTTQCNHTQSECKYPVELDLDRKVFNDQLSKEESINNEKLIKNLDQVWQFVNNLLNSIIELEKNRDLIFGKGCVQNMTNFLKKYQNESFSFKEYWAPISETYKKPQKLKKGSVSINTVDDIDNSFNAYINNYKNLLSLWEEEFIEKEFTNATKFIDDTKPVLMSYFVNFQNRSNGRLLKFYTDATQKCTITLNTIKDLKLMISKRFSIVREDFSKRNKELIEELEIIAVDWKKNSQKTILGRLEKANNKEFLKKIKKFENSFQNLRQFSVTSIGNGFPVTDFANICIQILELLMMEGEMWEAIELGKHYMNNESTIQNFNLQREKLLKDFNQGIEVGRKVLSEIIGCSFLREAQRLQEESLALKKQDSFLQSIDQKKTDSSKKKKGDKDLTNSNFSETAATPPVNPEHQSASSDKLISNSKDDDSKRAAQQKILKKMIFENISMNYESASQSFDTNRSIESDSQINLEGNNPKINEWDTSFNQLTTESTDNSHSKHSHLSAPPGLGSQSFVGGTSFTNNVFVDATNNFNLDTLSRTDLISIIQRLSNDKKQLVSSLISLQQEVQSMNIRYTNLIEMSREHESQTIKILEARMQQEMDEKIGYIQKLELRINQLEKRNKQNNQVSGNWESVSPKNESSPGSSNTNQIMHSSSVSGLFTTSSHTMNTVNSLHESNKYINSRRSMNGNGTRSVNNLRCGNCGDQGHISQNCNLGCRYCGDPKHLSENCNYENLLQTNVFNDGKNSNSEDLECL
ncbi:8196_t:CDS:2 [Diversispora eburnea]|uniref:8196_t:CDS:1 n=1 Tax=Diversispora eburnea TaxID=1213867 RepID=A0A9N8ZXD2_9GLOM|nr:8196_t:CDS:2 [Diversispora eburnea]